MNIFLHSLPTWILLTSLALCIGVSICRLWILPPSALTTTRYSEDLLSGIWRLLGIGIIVLAVSSITEFFLRTSEMSGAPVLTLISVLPAVLLRTHYGHIWIIRAAAIAVLWLGWHAGRRNLASLKPPAFILGTAAVIAITMSATGHASDLGDFTLLELMDWLHLMAALIWAGGLIVLSTVIVPVIEQSPDQDKTVIATIARKFSRIVNSVVMGVMVVTAFHKGWFYVNSFQALWNTPYGQTIIVKIFLLFLLLILGAYSEWYGDMPIDRWIKRFTKTARVQVIVIVGILFCAALLRHQIPARHAFHSSHSSFATEAVSSKVIASLKTVPESPKTGEDVTLLLSLTDLNGSPVKGLAVTHERLVHVMVISEDLASFSHIHPEDFGVITEEMIKDARFTLHYLFPMAGRYLIAVDTALDNSPISKLAYLNIGGSPKPGTIKKDLSLKKQFGDYTVSLASKPEKIKAGEETVFTYTIEKSGMPVTDLEPYLGATMHLAVVGADLSNFIHTHGELPGNEGEHHDHADMLHMKPPPPHFGPVINAEVVFPEKGLYKVFGEVRHRGKVLLLDFMIEAE
jgi:putative copper export protein